MGSLHQMKDPRDPFVATPDSIARAKAAQQAEREAAVEKVPELRSFLGLRQIIDRRVECHMALEPIFKRFGIPTVMRCLQLTCDAKGIDLVDEMAQGDEQQ
jgi:hypothetical protein